jgi:hypothetical protein
MEGLVVVSHSGLASSISYKATRMLEIQRSVGWAKVHPNRRVAPFGRRAHQQRCGGLRWRRHQGGYARLPTGYGAAARASTHPTTPIDMIRILETLY